jgi:hypothetical protein
VKKGYLLRKNNEVHKRSVCVCGFSDHSDELRTRMRMVLAGRDEIRPCPVSPLRLCEIFRNGRNEILFSLVIYCVNIFIVGNFSCAGCRQNDKACNTPTAQMTLQFIYLLSQLKTVSISLKKSINNSRQCATWQLKDWNLFSVPR